MTKKFIWIALIGLFALIGCSTTKSTSDQSEILREFNERFPKMGFREPRDSVGNRN